MKPFLVLGTDPSSSHIADFDANSDIRVISSGLGAECLRRRPDHTVISAEYGEYSHSEQQAIFRQRPHGYYWLLHDIYTTWSKFIPGQLKDLRLETISTQYDMQERLHPSAITWSGERESYASLSHHGIAAIAVAWMLGARQIGILGIDFPGDSYQWTDSDLFACHAIARLRDYYQSSEDESMRCELINLSPGSMVRPYLRYEPLQEFIYKATRDVTAPMSFDMVKGGGRMGRIPDYPDESP